ncbi:MAG: hypothetical protein ACLFQS_10850 [Bacteroidales bacterium]
MKQPIMSVLFLRKKIFYILFFCCVLAMPSQSCSTADKATKEQRQAEKRAEKKKEEGDKIMEKAREKHMQMQSKETRKRMKESRRKSDTMLNNRSKKPFFLVRWYRALLNKN